MHDLAFFRRPLTLAVLCMGAIGMLGCTSPPTAETTTAAQQTATPAEPTWAGTYQALLPCSDCPGIAISVQLRPDQTAVVRARQLASATMPPKGATHTSPFSFDAANPQLIRLQRSTQAPIAYRFLLGDDWLEVRHRSTGAALEPRTNYRLRKTSLPAD